ncbi:MAG: tetratricopeptide repeat protein [Rhodanobacteraceae bacterium]
MAKMKHLALIIGALVAAPAMAWAQSPAEQPLDAQARALMWSGDAGAATRTMREYVVSHPTDQVAVLDLARYLTWAGDYAGAKRVLDLHPEAAASPDGQVVLAAVLAWGGRIRAAQAVNAAALAADSDGLLPNYTQAVALRQSARPRVALPYVEAVKHAKPDSKDARDLERAVRIHTDSFIALDYQHGSDSDGLVRSQPTLRGEFAQGDALRWTMDLGHWDYRGPSTGPFSSSSGGRSVGENRGLFGVRYAPSLYTQLSAAVGQSSIPGDSLTLWRLGLDQRVSDTFRFDLAADRDRLDASPRSLSLGLDRTGIAGHAQWTPDFNWTGDVWLRRDHYSDSNASVDWNAALRRAVVRVPHFMLDLGVAAQHLSFDDNPGDGYYAPSDYRRYALVAYSYIGLNDNTGLAIQAGVGRQRDETFTSWRRANDISASLVIGIFSSWQLNLNAGYSQRILNTGAYAGHSWGATLTRRF